MKKQLLIAGIVLLSGCINEPPKAQTKHRVLTESAPSEVPSIDAKYQKMVFDSVRKWRADSRTLSTLQVLRNYLMVRDAHVHNLLELDTDIQDLSIMVIYMGGDDAMRKELKMKVLQRNAIIDRMNELGKMVENQDSIYMLTLRMQY